MNDMWNRIGKLAAQGGKQVATQVRKWGKQASLQTKLWQIRQERRDVFTKIGERCWGQYRQEAESLFSEAFSKLRSLEEEEKILQAQNSRRKDE